MQALLGTTIMYLSLPHSSRRIIRLCLFSSESTLFSFPLSCVPLVLIDSFSQHWHLRSHGNHCSWCICLFVCLSHTHTHSLSADNFLRRWACLLMWPVHMSSSSLSFMLAMSLVMWSTSLVVVVSSNPPALISSRCHDHGCVPYMSYAGMLSTCYQHVCLCLLVKLSDLWVAEIGMPLRDLKALSSLTFWQKLYSFQDCLYCFQWPPTNPTPWYYAVIKGDRLQALHNICLIRYTAS